MAEVADCAFSSDFYALKDQFLPQFITFPSFANFFPSEIIKIKMFILLFFTLLTSKNDSKGL